VKFLKVPASAAANCVLAHNVFDERGNRLLRKGALLTAQHRELLLQSGHREIYVAQLEASDLGENEAAQRVAAVVAGDGVFSPGAATGRANLKATASGLLRINIDAVNHLNEIDEGITVATLPAFSVVRAKQMVTTVKIIPFAVPQAAVEIIEKFCRTCPPIIRVQALPPRRVGLIVSAHQHRGDENQHERIAAEFTPALQTRLENLGSAIAQKNFVDHEPPDIAQAIRAQLAAGCEMILMISMTAIIDRHDVAPTAIEMSGGLVEHFGVPVDPGNLLLVGYHGATPIIGVPGCVRSPKINAFDLVLPRLLAGDHLTRRELVRLGHGGLLEEIRERHLLREAMEHL